MRMVEERFHRDDEGRPLREGRTPDELLQPGEIEYRACPYPGSRQPSALAPALVMNVSALRQTSAHWDELVEALGFLRTAYAEARGGYGPDVMDLWRVSQLGSALPWFFVLRGEPLPAYAAALSKATLGTGILAQRLMQRMLTERWLPPPFTAPALVALAESTGTLVGATEVCSAPEKMIARFLEILVAGTPRGDVAAVAPLIAQRDRLLGFAATYCGFKLVVWLYYQARRFLYADVEAHLGADVEADLGAGATADHRAELRALLDAPCEPPDFYVIEPDHLAGVPPALRAAWLGQLANLIVPFAPDGCDRPLLEGARRMAAAMLDDTRDPVARARATFDRLDAIYGELLADVEAGLRGARTAAPIDAAVRDRLIAASPRALFAALGAVLSSPPWM
ncbi:MAG: hypothetical protein ABIY55_05815 [Kofleriaceae bacterium]